MTSDTSDTSDTDEIPVAQRTEVERKPRMARTIRVLALPIVVFWLLIAVGVNVFVPQLEKVAEDVSVPLSPSDAPSVTGMKHIGEKFKEYDSDNLVLVTLVGEKPLGQDAHQYYDDLVKKLQQDTQHVEHALNFWGQRFTSSGVESYDHKAAYVQVNLRGDQGGAVGDKSVDAVRKIVADSKPPPGVKAYVAGQGALTDDTIVVGNASLFKMTIITIIIIAIMLMFVYRSIGTVLLTMVILFVGLATGRGVVALLGETGIMGLSTFAVNLLTALAIAAGTDYAIFMVGRYQEGRERGLDREAAYYDTFAGVSKVVLGSGLTIVGALACLHFTRLPYFSSLAFPCAIGLLVVVAAGVTLTPALIVFASGFGLFDPKREFNYTRWRRLATAIVRWPAPILATSVILAIVGALGLMGFNPRYNDLYYLPQSASSVQAYTAADQHFTQARLNPDLLMIESDHDLRNPTDMLVLDKIAGAIFRVPGIERVQSITRPLGPPIQDGSIPFQLSVQSAPIRDNLNYLKDRIADIKKITGYLDTLISLLERQYKVTQDLANAADDSSKTAANTAAITDEIRDHIADFDDFWRPIRSYFYWEKHCFDIPICWSLRGLFDALDGFDKLAEQFHNLTKDLGDTAKATHELLAIIPAEYRHLEGDPGYDADHLQLVRQPDRSVRPADRHERRDGQVLQRLSGGEPLLPAARDLPEPGLPAGVELDGVAGRQGRSLHHHSRSGSGDDGGNLVRRSGAPSGQGGAETHLAAERRHLPRRYGRDVLRHRQRRQVRPDDRRGGLDRAHLHHHGDRHPRFGRCGRHRRHDRDVAGGRLRVLDTDLAAPS